MQRLSRARRYDLLPCSPLPSQFLHTSLIIILSSPLPLPTLSATGRSTSWLAVDEVIMIRSPAPDHPLSRPQQALVQQQRLQPAWLGFRSLCLSSYSFLGDSFDYVNTITPDMKKQFICWRPVPSPTDGGVLLILGFY